MMASDERSGPACALGATEGMARRERWLNLADTALLGKAPTPSGVRLRYRGDDDVERELRDLAGLERECCSFATWRVERDANGVVVDVSSTGDGIWAVQAMFGEAETAPD